MGFLLKFLIRHFFVNIYCISFKNFFCQDVELSFFLESDARNQTNNTKLFNCLEVTGLPRHTCPKVKQPTFWSLFLYILDF